MTAHLIFEMSWVLVDQALLNTLYPQHIGDVLAEHYGGTAEVWRQAYQDVKRDWDSYWSDLDLTGDEPVENLWEGMLRVARAMFRIAGVAEPPKRELIEFSRVLPSLVCARFDVLYPGLQPLLEQLHTAGLRLHVATKWTTRTARVTLRNGGVLPYFIEPVRGVDVRGSYEHDYATLAHQLNAVAADCVAIDHNPDVLERARAAGMQTLLVSSPQDLFTLTQRIHTE